MTEVSKECFLNRYNWRGFMKLSLKSKDKQTIDNCDGVVEEAAFIDRGSGKRAANCPPRQRERVDFEAFRVLFLGY